MSAERPPPQNLDAEEHVLGAIMLAGTAEAGSTVVAKVRSSGLVASDFYRESHRCIYTAALALEERVEPTDVLALEHELGGRLADAGGKERLVELAGLVPATANAAYYAKLVVDAAERREQAAVGLALRHAAENGAVDDALRERVKGLFGAARVKATEDPTITVAEFVARRDESTSEPLVSSAQGTQLPPGGLAILAAKVHDGKTTLAVEFVLHASAGRDYLGLIFPRPLNVLVIENEGPREAFRAKLAERLTHWKHGGEPLIWDSPAEWGQVRISDRGVRERLRAVAAAREIDLIVSDSLTRFGVRGNGTPEETREFIEWLTVLGLGRDVAFLLLHHPRTRPEPGETELERLAGAWPPHADLILLLQKLGGSRARLSFPKTRWALADKPPIILAFDRATESFSYVADDEPEERDYLAELVELMADGDWWTVNALRKPKDKGGIGAMPNPIKQALSGERFESATGADIGLRQDATYYRLRQASRPPETPETLQGPGRKRSKRLASPPRERARGGDACSDRDASEEDGSTERCVQTGCEATREPGSFYCAAHGGSTVGDEIERLAEVARDAQRDVNNDAAEEGGREEK